ncbi:MAG: hypothetical protein AAFQ82_23740, partial [Myxococcota bacterium]
MLVRSLKTVALALCVLGVLGCGLAGGVDEREPTREPFLRYETADGTITEVDLTLVYAYRNASLDLWGPYSGYIVDAFVPFPGTGELGDLILNFEDSVLEDAPLSSPFLQFPSPFHPYLRLENEETDQEFYFDRGTLSYRIVVEEDGQEWIQIEGRDLELFDGCRERVRLARLDAQLRVGNEDLLALVDPEARAELAEVAGEVAGRGGLVRFGDESRGLALTDVALEAGRDPEQAGRESLEFFAIRGSECDLVPLEFVQLVLPRLDLDPEAADGTWTGVPVEPLQLFVELEDPIENSTVYQSSGPLSLEFIRGS